MATGGQGRRRVWGKDGERGDMGTGADTQGGGGRNRSLGEVCKEVHIETRDLRPILCSFVPLTLRTTAKDFLKFRINLKV